MIVSVVSSLLPPPLLLPNRSLCSSLGVPVWKKASTTSTKRRRRKWEEDLQGSRGVCRASLAQDAPFAVAIGASILNSLVFPLPVGPDDEEGGGGALDSTDMRFAVMGILSFIPYFNWMSWIFAWLDTGSQRYLLYAIVYLAPYLRTNLSLSPNDSWLPVASIFSCIIHVQLETSIRNGDINSTQILDKTLKSLFMRKREEDSHFHGHQEIDEGRNEEQGELPSPRDESRNKVREWGIPRKRVDDLLRPNENQDLDDNGNKSD